MTLGIKQNLIKADLLAARTTPVSRWLLLGALALSTVSCAANLSTLDNLDTKGALELALHSAAVPIMIASLIAGIYATSSDRRWGLIDQRLLSQPSRLGWLRSKLWAQAIVGLCYGILGSGVTVATASIIFWQQDSTFDATSSTSLLTLVGLVATAVCFSLLGAALGSLSAATPAAIAITLVWSLILEPPLILGLPSIAKWLPVAAALGATNAPDPNLLTQPIATVVLATWVVLTIAVCSHRIRKADL